MSHDPALRVLLGLILICLLLLVAQGFGLGPGAGEGPYRISVIKAKTPWLMRINTVTGRVEQFEFKGERRWVTLGERERELELGELEAGEGELDGPFAEAGTGRPTPPRPGARPRPAPGSPAPRNELAALVEALGPDNPREIRTWAVRLLGGYVAEAPDTAVPALIGVLGDPDGEVVAGAARSLGASPDARSALRELRSHPDARVQAAAREALAGRP